MARNKYPEETVAKILDVALALFCEKGYEHTTMADIVDNLGGLTKGAVYHHFKSKEDIMNAALDRAAEPMVAQIQAICADRKMTALEKLRALYAASSEASTLELWEKAHPSADPMKNARLLAAEYQGSLESAVAYMQPVLEQGIEEGSVTAAHPREVAEVLTLVSNLWVAPIFHGASREEFERRLEVFYQMAEGLGVPLCDMRAADGIHAWAPKEDAFGVRDDGLDQHLL